MKLGLNFNINYNINLNLKTIILTSTLKNYTIKFNL